MDTFGPTKRILIIVGVLIVQATEVLPMGPQIIVWVMQVSLFSSIHIDRVHCRGVTMIRHFFLYLISSTGYVQFLESTLANGNELSAIIASTPTPPATAKSPDETDVAMDMATLPDHTPHPTDSTTTPKATEDNNTGYCSVS